jgi:ethanolamine transporter EutH
VTEAASTAQRVPRRKLLSERFPSYTPAMLALRLGFTVAVMAVVVWLLLVGRFAEAILLVVVAVWLRRAVESGRVARLGGRLAKSS